MRLFVAVWPPPGVLDVVGGLARPEWPGLRWTTHDQWHVTLRFLGRVDDELVGEVGDALRAALAEVGPVDALAGPAVERLGRGVVSLPVAGLDDVAARVVEATAAHGRPPDDRPFHGHLTLARAKGRLPPDVIGMPVAARWTVTDVVVVESQLHPRGARYRIVERVALAR